MEIEGGGAELKPQLRGVVPVGSLSRIDCTASLPQQMTVTPIWVLSLFSVDLIEGSGSHSCTLLCRLVCLRSILLLPHYLNSWRWQTQHFSQLFVNWSLDEPNSFGWMGDYNHKCAHLCQSAINLNWVLVGPLEQLISTLALPVLWNFENHHKCGQGITVFLKKLQECKVTLWSYSSFQRFWINTHSSNNIIVFSLLLDWIKSLSFFLDFLCWPKTLLLLLGNLILLRETVQFLFVNRETTAD